MFGDELHQLLQRDVCSYDPQQNTLVLLHEKIQNTYSQTSDENCRRIHLVSQVVTNILFHSLC